jgi:hypothetical protein
MQVNIIPYLVFVFERRKFVHEKTTFKLSEQLIFHNQKLCGVVTYFQGDLLSGGGTRWVL